MGKILLAGVRAARDYAIKAHGDQRYGDYPYVTHLDAVSAIAAAYNLPYNIRVAAYLHDILEDTPVTEDELYVEYGSKITSLVRAVTNDSDPRPGYKERTYINIVLGGDSAISLKLCDRIANLRACVPGKHDRLLRKYVQDSSFDLILFRLVGSRGKPSPGVASLWMAYYVLIKKYRGEYGLSETDIRNYKTDEQRKYEHRIEQMQASARESEEIIQSLRNQLQRNKLQRRAT